MSSSRYHPYTRYRRSNTTRSQRQRHEEDNENVTHGRYNPSGYEQYRTTSDPAWKYTHRTVAQNKIGRHILPTEEVHHINKNKTDNRSENLTVVDRDIHRLLHSHPVLEKAGCFRCGHPSHHVSECFANTDALGRSILDLNNRTSVYLDNDNDSDSDSSDSGSYRSNQRNSQRGATQSHNSHYNSNSRHQAQRFCSRCGRNSHTASNCFASRDIDGNPL